MCLTDGSFSLTMNAAGIFVLERFSATTSREISRCARSRIFGVIPIRLIVRELSYSGHPQQCQRRERYKSHQHQFRGTPPRSRALVLLRSVVVRTQALLSQEHVPALERTPCRCLRPGGKLLHWPARSLRHFKSLRFECPVHYIGCYKTLTLST